MSIAIARLLDQKTAPSPDQRPAQANPRLGIRAPFKVQPSGCPVRGINCRLIIRWLKFNAVGAIGIIVQLSALGLLVHVLRLPTTVATGLAVETAIVHNFIWHQGWTWADRKHTVRSPFIGALRALVRFNMTAGLVSLFGNMFFMHLLVTTAGLGLLRSNLLTIAMCSLVNFIVSDRFVFVGGR